MEGNPLPSQDLVQTIREKYFKIKLKHSILKKKYEEIKKEYFNVKKELDIVQEELDKHESCNSSQLDTSAGAHVKNGVGLNSFANDSESFRLSLSQVIIKKEIDDKDESIYSSDEFNNVVTVHPNHSSDELNNECGEIIKVNMNGRLKKRSRDFYKRHNEFIQNSCHSDLQSDHHASPYPNISPVQCYYGGDKNKVEVIDDDVLEDDGWTHGSCNHSHTLESFKDCKICSSDLPSDDNIPLSSANHLYGDFSSTPGSLRRRKRSTKPYKCEICGNFYAGAYNYNRHMLIHTGEKPFKCHICDKTFARKDKYKFHIRTNHQTSDVNSSVEDQSVLDLSDKNRDNSVLIDPSIVKIEPLEESSTEIINSSFMHSRKSGKKKINNITLECDICYQKVQGSLNLIKHKERHAATKPKVCDICGKVFQKAYSYNRHHMLHTGEKPFICNLCGEGFSRNDKLLVHTRKHKRYSPEKMTFKCDVCDLFFSESEHVTKHQMMHTGEEWFTCDICFKNFKLESDLIVHRKSRHIIRPESKKKSSFSQRLETFKPKTSFGSKIHYKCYDCGKTFTERVCLVRHLRTHLTETTYKCRGCGKEFTEKFMLNRHEKTHSKVKPHVCEVCGKNFLQKATLIRHKMIHDNIRPYKCDDCGKSFIEKHKLANHKKTHATLKCGVCNECFTDPEAYCNHQLLHNDDEILLT